jgi:outer membrane protein assembly factor BamB
MRTLYRCGIFIAGCAIFAGISFSQFGRGGGTWNTAGADAQRTSWARTDSRISAASMPKFQFLWKVKVDNAAKDAWSLSSAVMVDSYIGYRGFRSYAFLSGASNKTVALDTDLGRVEWLQSFGGASAASTAACPGALTSGVTRSTPLAPAAPPAAGAGGGRGAQRASSGVSDPGAGAIPAPGPARGGFGGPGGRGGSGGRGPGGFGAPGGARAPDAVYAVSTDGMLRTLYISNGENAKPPVRFLPANANPSGLLLVDNVVYAATSGNCGGAPNGVWAIETMTDGAAPMHWSTNGGGVAGNYGPALGTDGTVYAATLDGDYSPVAFSDSVVALDKSLKLKDWFTPGKSAFTSSPVVFSVKEGDKERDLIAVANKDGHLYLLDSAALGGADHKTPLSSAPFATSGADAGALASWEDAAGTRWVLAGAPNAIVAYKVVGQNGKYTLQTGWTSPNIASPLPPIVVDGIVFAVASGAGSKPAVLYALDGETGKELFNSGSTITGPVMRTGGLAASAGHLYIAGADSTVYAFGVPLVSPDLAKKVQ